MGLAAAALIAIAVLASVFFGLLPIETSVQDRSEQAEADPVISPLEPGLRELSLRTAISPAVSEDGRSIWFFTPDGSLYRIVLDEADEEFFLLPDAQPIYRALWPDSGSDFIVIQSLEGEVPFRLYQSAARTFTDLPGNVESLAWLADGRRIVYVWRSADGRRQLKIGNSDTSGYETLAELEAYAGVYTSRDEGLAVLFRGALGDLPASAQRFDLVNRNFFPIFLPDGAREISLSPDGQRLLVQATGPAGEMLVFLVDTVSGQSRKIFESAELSQLAWSPDASGVFAVLPDSGGSKIIFQPVADGGIAVVLEKNDRYLRPEALVSGGGGKILTFTDLGSGALYVYVLSDSQMKSIYPDK